jgi:hypothetical protein
MSHQLLTVWCTWCYNVVIIYLYAQPDGKWGEHDEVCKAVAQAGDVTVLQWMYDNQALFDEMLCTEAARGNKVTIDTLLLLYTVMCAMLKLLSTLSICSHCSHIASVQTRVLL